MRIDDFIIELQKRRDSKCKQVFEVPPNDHEEFKKLLGIWIGLGEALSMIEDARKKEQDE